MFSARRIVFSVLLFETLAIVIALALGYLQGNIETPFKEGGLITWISFFQLLLIAGLSWKVFTLHNGVLNRRGWRSPQMVWAIIAIGFIYLAFDELTLIHETLDKFIHNLFVVRETALTDRLDDIIVGFYGLVGIGILYYYREALKKYVEVFPYLISGFVFLFVMVGFDIVGNRYDPFLTMTENISLRAMLHTWFSVAEDLFKMLSEGMFLVAFYRCCQMASEQKAAQQELSGVGIRSR